MGDGLVHTGIFATKEDTQKMVDFANKGWQQGEMMIVFSVGQGIKKDEATGDAKKECHKLALAYGLPEIQGFYGMDMSGEFVRV